MPRRTTDFRGLAAASRVRLLGAVQEAPGSTLKELSISTGIHLNTARDHLLALVGEGLVAVGTRPPRGRGRPPSVYAPVNDPATNPVALERVARSLKTTDRLRSPLSRDAARQLDVLYEHLADTGLEPETPDDDVLEVRLVPCPFFTIVTEDQDFACRVHRRLLSDTLAQVPGPLELEVLEPFTAPDTCRVHLRTTAD